ncbi:MAG: pyridoxamine 5'-phosphate oxidase [Propionibacteriales bacterium]|nr:pyridoxamine 5'-phosphate oxidase [Propionibacteriales bacterium]
MDDKTLEASRKDYTSSGLTEEELAADPFTQFRQWIKQAQEAGLYEPNAMVLTTVSGDGVPSSRMVLLKGFGPDGFVFFTNYASRKGTDLEADGRCALLFPWHPLERQVRIEGTASRLDESASDSYFASRPRGAQLGAWASPQSSVVSGREVLDEEYDEVSRRFPGDVPRPPHWGGYRVVAATVEFWQGRPGRMHDRLRFRRTPEGWTVERLAP